MKKTLGSVFLALGLLVPVTTVLANDHAHKVHEWNNGENDAWHRYLKEHHTKDHDWDHASKRERARYWKWRDQHPDKH